MPSHAEGVTLKPEEFRLLRDLFAARTGLHFGPESRFAMERRLRERLLVLKLPSFAEYHHYLRFNVRAPDEWDEAVDLLTTNETYFFREDRQLRAFQNEILPMLHDQLRPHHRLNIWSAGCSTGEEAYTIAILVHQSGIFPISPRGRPGDPDWATASMATPGVDREDQRSWSVRIYGSDLSRRCVAAARRGVYSQSSFRATTQEQRRAYFTEVPGGWQVVDVIRELCHFGQMNLADTGVRVLGRADVIFCRNVLIYFDARARRAAIQVLYDRLNPGGVLLLGHSESLLNVSTAFELLHLKDDLVYRKPFSARSNSSTPDAST